VGVCEPGVARELYKLGFLGLRSERRKGISNTGDKYGPRSIFWRW
jgi:hypothetical protein